MRIWEKVNSFILTFLNSQQRSRIKQQIQAYQIKKFHGGLDVTKHADNNCTDNAGSNSESLVFMSDIYNMNGAMNADLVRDYAALAVEDPYPEGAANRQVDPA